MIPIFRKIRKQLADENRPIKYIRYAIGEIVLVVIGILIALSINNWNEKRKSNLALEELLDVFEKDLETNISKATRLINAGYRLDSIYQFYIDHKITEDMIVKNPYLAYSAFHTNTVFFLQDNLDDLLALEKEFPKKYKPITNDLKIFKRQIESQNKWEKFSVETSIEEYKNLTNNFSWYGEKDSISIQEMAHYFATNLFINHRILNYRSLFLGENVWDATFVRSSALALLWKIKSIRGTQNDKMIDFFKKYGLVPNNEALCDSDIKNSGKEVTFRNQFIFYNNYDEKVVIQKTSNGRYTRKIVVDPQSFISVGVSTDSDDVVKLMKNDTCIKKYRIVPNGYTIANNRD